jgi:hypothetical protein
LCPIKVDDEFDRWELAALWVNRGGYQEIRSRSSRMLEQSEEVMFLGMRVKLMKLIGHDPVPLAFKMSTVRCPGSEKELD